MADIATVWDSAQGRGDYAVSRGALQQGSDLATAILISLFTDRRAADDDRIPDGSTDARGWWGDLNADYAIGSRLWLYARAKQTPQVLAGARDAIDEALQWLIDDGVVAKFDRTVEYTRPGMIGIEIVAWRSDGTREAMGFSYVWSDA